MRHAISVGLEQTGGGARGHADVAVRAHTVADERDPILPQGHDAEKMGQHGDWHLFPQALDERLLFRDRGVSGLERFLYLVEFFDDGSHPIGWWIRERRLSGPNALCGA